MRGPAVFVPVKVIVCATSSVARYRRMPGVLHRMWKSEGWVSGGRLEHMRRNILVHYTFAEFRAFPSLTPGLVIGVSR